MERRISVKASPDVIHVPDDYDKIQWAVENASGGDTIFVHKGTYYERVIINKSVSLIGEDRDSTIVDGKRSGNVISITADNVNISGFTIRHSGHEYYDSGIYVDHSSGNSISHNTITNNKDGITLLYSSSNVISGNTVTHNYDGISLLSSISNVFLGNTISSNNNDGISLYSSSSNVFLGNTISSNNYYGIYFTLSSINNNIYCNNFNNTDQVWSDKQTNVWDDGDEGNYWGDYIGTDLYSGPYQNETGSDGIGDSPYVINAENKDNYPLMGMFSDFKVAWKEESHHVTTICNSTITEFRFEVGAETGNKIIHFNVTGKDNAGGFCRIAIPTELMNYPYIVLVDAEEIIPKVLDISNETHVCLYFTYIHSTHTISVVSSKTLHFYNELLDKYVKLQIDLYNLNATYQKLLDDYSGLSGNYSQLQGGYRELNKSYQKLLDDYSGLSGNYSQLQGGYRELNKSYQKHLSVYSENVHNIRTLMYIFAATTAIFIITTIYLSKHAHASKKGIRRQTIRAQRLYRDPYLHPTFSVKWTC